MLIVDDILFSPARGLLFILREIHNAAVREAANEADAIRAELSDLYMMLETGRITEQEFDAQEKRLLDRLEKIGPPQDRVESGEESGGETDEP